MSQKLIAVATQLFSTQVFQNYLRNSTYKPEHCMGCAIAGARNFLEVCEQREFTGNTLVALAYYANLLGDYLFDYQDAQMKELSNIAIDVAVQFDGLLSAAIGEAPKQLVKELEGSKPEDYLDLPIEKCGLPGPVLESLMAAGYTTAQGVIDADTQGKIVGLPGIQVATRDRTVSKLKEAMKAAAEAAKAEQVKAETATKTAETGTPNVS